MDIKKYLQIAAIKGEKILYKQYGDLIFVSDGVIGAYFRESELKIDRKKLSAATFVSCSLDPYDLLTERTPAKETRIAYKMRSSEYAIKLRSSTSNAECFVAEKYLKMFKGYSAAHIKDEKEPVLLFLHYDPYGIILPMKISDWN